MTVTRNWLTSCVNRRAKRGPLSGRVIDQGVRERFLDFPEFLALVGKFTGEGEGAALPGLIGCKPAPVLFQTLAVTLLLLLKPVKRMFKTGDRPERRDGDRQFDFIVSAGALEQRLVVVVVATAERFAGIDEIEPADASGVNLALLL